MTQNDSERGTRETASSANARKETGARRESVQVIYADADLNERNGGRVRVETDEEHQARIRRAEAAKRGERVSSPEETASAASGGRTSSAAARSARPVAVSRPTVNQGSPAGSATGSTARSTSGNAQHRDQAHAGGQAPSSAQAESRNRAQSRNQGQSGNRTQSREQSEAREQARRRAERARERKLEEEDRDEDEPPEQPEKKPGKQKKRRKGGAFRTILILLLVALVAFYGLCYSLSVKTQYKPYDEIAEEADYNLVKKGEKGVTNILLIGTDARIVGEDSRSDAMIVVSICPLQHKIHLTSILRDSYVDIPGYGKNRINHAYQMGGAQLLIQTIEQNFSIRIDGYAKVDFYSFIEVIDAIGGVEMEITAPEVQYVDAYLSEVNQLMGIDAQDSFIWKEGTYTLNGRQALAYGRIRYIGTDFGRTERQRKIITAALKKVAKTNPITLYRAAGTVMSELITNIPAPKLAALIMSVPLLATCKIESTQIPYDGLWWNDTMPNGQEVLSMDMDATRAQFKSEIYGE